jgi:hypothetical protein
MHKCNVAVGDDWHIQVSIATSLLELEGDGKLSPKEEPMVPWVRSPREGERESPRESQRGRERQEPG